MTSCGDEPIVDSSASVSEGNDSEPLSKTKNTAVIYKRDGGCDTFMQSIDFSSLCLTDEKQLDFYIETWTEFTCQHLILDDNREQVTSIVVSYTDYNSSETEKMERDQLNAKSQLLRSAKYLFKSSMLIDNLGDGAYIGTSAAGGGNVKVMKILLNNVTVLVKTLNLEENCLSTDEELIKLGRLILDRIKE